MARLLCWRLGPRPEERPALPGRGVGRGAALGSKDLDLGQGRAPQQGAKDSVCVTGPLQRPVCASH